MSKQRKNVEYPEQVVSRRGIVELRMSPASMFELLAERLTLPREQIVRLAEDQIKADPRRETFWMLVAYIAMSDGGTGK